MASDRSRALCIICPGPVKAGRSGEIEAALHSASFAVLDRTQTTLTAAQAAELYEPLEGEPEYAALCSYLCSSPCILLALTKTGASSALAAFKADFASATEHIRPVLHTSKDPADAARELALFFPWSEPRDLSLVVAPEDDAIFAAARRDGILTLATKQVSFTAEEAAVLLAAGAVDPQAEVPLVAALLEGRASAIRSMEVNAGPTVTHLSSSPASARSEAAQLFGDDVLATQTTFAFVKPDAVGDAESIRAEAEVSGFTVLAADMLTLSAEQAEAFYAEHSERDFFGDLVGFMTSGPVLAMVLERPCAIATWRSLVGPTDSAKARESAPRSLRARYGTDGQRNACHGSDGTASAQRESAIFFPQVNAVQTTIALVSESSVADELIAAAAKAGLVVTSRTVLQLDGVTAAAYLDTLGDDMPPLAPRGPKVVPVGSYEAAMDHLTSEPVAVLAFSGMGAIYRLRALMGPLDPAVAKVRCPGTVRARFGVDKTHNVGFASPTVDAAFRHRKCFFPAARLDALPSSKVAKAYANDALMPCLTTGLVELCKAKPEEPVQWLAEWLIANNPQAPVS